MIPRWMRPNLMISSNQPKRPRLILDPFNNHEHVAFDIYQLLSFSPSDKKIGCVIITNLNTPEHIWFGMPYLVLKHWWNSTWDVPTCSGQQRTTRFEGTIAKAVRTKERGSPTSTPVVAWHVEAGWPSETRARVSILQFQQGDHRQKCLVLRCFRF